MALISVVVTIASVSETTSTPLIPKRDFVGPFRHQAVFRPRLCATDRQPNEQDLRAAFDQPRLASTRRHPRLSGAAEDDIGVRGEGSCETVSVERRRDRHDEIIDPGEGIYDIRDS